MVKHFYPRCFPDLFRSWLLISRAGDLIKNRSWNYNFGK